MPGSIDIDIDIDIDIYIDIDIDIYIIIDFDVYLEAGVECLVVAEGQLTLLHDDPGGAAGHSLPVLDCPLPHQAHLHLSALRAVRALALHQDGADQDLA